MSDYPIVMPDPWRDLDLAALRGVSLVIGAPDTGKTTFAHTSNHPRPMAQS